MSAVSEQDSITSVEFDAFLAQADCTSEYDGWHPDCYLIRQVKNSRSSLPRARSTTSTAKYGALYFATDLRLRPKFRAHTTA